MTEFDHIVNFVSTNDSEAHFIVSQACFLGFYTVSRFSKLSDRTRVLIAGAFTIGAGVGFELFQYALRSRLSDVTYDLAYDGMGIAAGTLTGYLMGRYKIIERVWSTGRKTLKYFI